MYDRHVAIAASSLLYRELLRACSQCDGYARTADSSEEEEEEAEELEEEDEEVGEDSNGGEESDFVCPDPLVLPLATPVSQGFVYSRRSLPMSAIGVSRLQRQFRSV